MRYRRLGSTGLRVSVVGVGTWQPSGERVSVLSGVGGWAAGTRDLGVNLVDTTECYGDHLAKALIGEAIRGRRATG
jgi:aryl-alcohol dehydrogenase-like predicted oxidoreductase